jgi:DNA-directed RNA polymerase subunit M/transcription elongation factor TFIIS
MKHFCDICENLIEADVKNNTLKFVCMTCHTIYKAEPDDSLRYEETRGGNLVIFETILHKARQDPVGLKIHKQCPKCKHHLAKPVRLGDELRLINICESCSFQWIDMEE